jgi:hypothetical protein
MNPKRGVQSADGKTFGSGLKLKGPREPAMSLCRRHQARFNPHQERQKHFGEGQPPVMQTASTTTRFDFGCRCEIVGELGRVNFRRDRRIP